MYYSIGNRKEFLMEIMLGPGILMLIEVAQEPKTGDVLPLSNTVLGAGRFRLTREGNHSWREMAEYPYYTHERVAEISDTEPVFPTVAFLNC